MQVMVCLGTVIHRVLRDLFFFKGVAGPWDFFSVQEAEDLLSKE